MSDHDRAGMMPFADYLMVTNATGSDVSTVMEPDYHEHRRGRSDVPAWRYTCDPEIPEGSGPRLHGDRDDAGGNMPSNVRHARPMTWTKGSHGDGCYAHGDMRGTTSTALTSDVGEHRHGHVLGPPCCGEDAEGSSYRSRHIIIGERRHRQRHCGDHHTRMVSMYGEAPSRMPMNVMAPTSDTMITVVWDVPRRHGGAEHFSDPDMVQSAYMACPRRHDERLDGRGRHGHGNHHRRRGRHGHHVLLPVTAMNSDGMGTPPDGIMVTVNATMAENMAPMAGAAVADQMVYVDDMVMVQSNFSDPDEDMLSYMASSSDDMIATATVDDMGMVTITGVAEGMATITVTATDPDGMYAMQTIMVTVMMATTMMDELGTATGIGVGFNRGGALQVYWTKAANAMGYIIVAIDTADSTVGGDPVVLNDGDAETRNISGLTPGATYDIYVIATGSGGAFELGEPYGVTAK